MNILHVKSSGLPSLKYKLPSYYADASLDNLNLDVSVENLISVVAKPTEYETGFIISILIVNATRLKTVLDVGDLAILQNELEALEIREEKHRAEIQLYESDREGYLSGKDTFPFPSSVSDSFRKFTYSNDIRSILDKVAKLKLDKLN